MQNLTPRTWREIDLGHGRLTLDAKGGVTLTLDVLDGGGVTRSYAAWRLADRTVLLVEAGEA
jgi:hypothetical protein